MKNIITLCVLLLTSNAFSSGFRLSEQSARASAMGNSFVAINDDVSSVWYNPAAIVDLDKTNVSLGSVMVYSSMKHKYATGEDEINKKLHIPPQFYATHKINDKFSLGLGFNAPFGLQTDWGTTIYTSTISTLSDLKVLNTNLNAAYKINDKFSFAIGADYVYLDATLNKMVGTKEFILKGDGTGLGYNLATLYKLNEKINFGANYRSQVKIEINDGTAELGTTNNPATTKITLPDTFQIGTSYKANEKWLFTLTADYTNWTTYRRLIVKSNTISTMTGGATDTSIDNKNWKSVWAYRLGTEYSYSENLKLRTGVFYDFNPVKEDYFETRIPDSDRIAFSIGAGYKKENWTFDLSYTYLYFTKRTIDSSLVSTKLYGDYEAYAHLPGFSIGYKF